MASISPPAAQHPWELAAENIAVKIRWFGLLFGYIVVQVDPAAGDRQAVLNAILALGAVYALLDTWYRVKGSVFLGRYPIVISLMEALFIGLLCAFHGGLDSPFRYYYFLSLICCAVRYSSRVTYATCALHCLSCSLLYLTLDPDERKPLTLILALVVMLWLTWASDSMAFWLKQVGNHLHRLNTALQAQQAELETRIADRTRELQEAQAHLLHQEKMAAFGLLAAGIAHEVGNPLTSISAMVQLLRRRDSDEYSQEKLTLVSGQLQRIQTTLHELINFSRPTSTERVRVSLGEILNEALNIAKYYKRTKDRQLIANVPNDLPALMAVRDQLVQVFLNLVLNAVDATRRNGRIEIHVQRVGEHIEVHVKDDGCGIPPENTERVYQPYFTTKKHGTGLGLFVTRKLVGDHGGCVEFVSTPGEGTTFCVRLPAEGKARTEHAVLEQECCDTHRG